MLPRHRRIRSADQFRAVTRSGVRASAACVVVQVRARVGESQSGLPTRVGFVVGRSVGGAVPRNRVTRRLRHLMASRIPTLPPDLEIVVRALPAAGAATSEQLGRDLDLALGRCLKRLGQPAMTLAEGSP